MSTRVYLGAGTAAAAALLVGYLIYFDHKRRQDPEFRKKINRDRKQAARERAAREDARKKQTERAAAQQRAGPGSMGGPGGEDPAPAAGDDQGEFFMKQLQLGEDALKLGPSAYATAATHFFAALRMYPEPMNLLMVFQQSLPEPVLNTIMEKMAAEIKTKAKDYYNHFPPKDMNVEVKEVVQNITADGKRIIRRGIILTKDIMKGEEIYRETPIIAELEASIEVGKHCVNCLKPVTNVTHLECLDCAAEFYCGEACRSAAKLHYHNILCTKKEGTGVDSQKLRDLCREENLKYPLAIARFLSKMVHEEKVNPTEGKSTQYSTWDHVERLYDLKQGSQPGDLKERDLVSAIIAPQVPGFDQFLTADRYKLLKNKLYYNAYAIRTAEISPSATPSTEYARGSFDPAERTGAGLYLVTSYISHSCAPNVELRFVDGTSQMSLVASETLKKGDEVHTTYIPVNGKSTPERRKELKAKFSFHCKCSKCVSK